jgi:hypothetical protein
MKKNNNEVIGQEKLKVIDIFSKHFCLNIRSKYASFYGKCVDTSNSLSSGQPWSSTVHTSKNLLIFFVFIQSEEVP